MFNKESGLNCNKEKEFLNKKYDIVVWKNAIDYGTRMDSELIKMTKRTTFKNVELLNYNGLGIGTAYFKGEDGTFIILPWCAIVSMIPTLD